jgi:hypothetical protein
MATTSEVLQHEFVNINGIRMHYVTMGNGPLIYFCMDSLSFRIPGDTKFLSFQSTLK